MYFKEYKSGNYVNKNDYKAFKPSFINQRWQWDNAEIDRLLEKANFELGKLQNYSEQVANIDVYIQMHIRSEANKSSKIEGTKTSIQEDLMNPEDLSPEKRDDVKEVDNYVNALSYGVKRIVEDDFPLSSRLIREIHQELMSGVRGEHKSPGEFRRSQNWIGGSMPSNAMFVPPSHEYLPNLISDLEKFINNKEVFIPQLIKNAIVHYQFETIHPFLDGNGRTGRILIPLLLLSNDTLTKPCFYISDYFERNRAKYYHLLDNVRVNHDIESWIIFFLEACIDTAVKARMKFKAAIDYIENLRQDIGNIAGTYNNVNQIVNLFFENPVLSTSEIEKLTGIKKSTVYRTLNALETSNYLKEITGFSRNKIYAMHEYLKIFES